MRRKVLTIVLVAVMIAIAPISLICAGLFSPAQFDETYYGQLAHMYNRLKSTQGKKVVIIGNSSVAFGVRSDLLEQELPDYKVVNFGLYAAIGTKAMLDLSRVNIGEGDIVIVMPEPVPQSYSLYFSGKEVWRAIDSNLSMFNHIASDNKRELTGNFLSFLGEKMEHLREGKPVSEGAYSQSAFNLDGVEVGYMTFDRPYNRMFGGYDSTSLSDYDPSLISPSFLDYLNEYNSFATKKGATVYLGFTPVNSLAVSLDAKDNADIFCSYIYERIDFEILGHPWKYMLDYEWFYDNNVHLNSAGMLVYTSLLADDIKLTIGDFSPVGIALPSKPTVPIGNTVGGDNRDAGKFTYEIRTDIVAGKYIHLTGLFDDEGQTSYIIPSDYDGVPVRSFSAGVFSGNASVSEITVPKSVGIISDNSFNGCAKLVKLIFQHDSIQDINTGNSFLKGADNCYIYLKNGVNIDTCFGGWETYQDRIITY